MQKLTSTPRPDLPHIHLVATGGTIAMRLDSDQGGARPAVSGADLVAAVPEVAQIARLSVEEFSNIPMVRSALPGTCPRASTCPCRRPCPG